MICNECAQRKCKAEPVRNRSGLGPIYTCRVKKEPRSGWGFLEMVLDTSTAATVTLLERHSLRVVETKKGLIVRYVKNKRSY